LEELKGIYSKENKDVIELLSVSIKPHARQIAEGFYKVMLSNKDTEVFLDSELVKERLTDSMTAWITALFDFYGDDAQLRRVMQQQIDVGHVHARIDLPMSFVNYGARVLKKVMSEQLCASSIEFGDGGGKRAIVILNQIIDTMISLINESYVKKIVIDEKSAQAFRMHVSAKALAFDCERLRSALLEWVRELLSVVCEPEFNKEEIPSLRFSEFGLWLVHKGELILADRDELPKLKQFLHSTEDLSRQFSSMPNRDPAFVSRLISMINNEVDHISWLLKSVSREMLDLDNSRDTLTNLFNRRYIPTVLTHEVDCSIKTGARFGILYADIDHFKMINDDYGHENGDAVLRQFSELLSRSVRAGDFLFRYGGEEFLVVVADVQRTVLCEVAEKIRRGVENTTFKLSDGKIIPVTVSIGAAIHDGHPDYMRTINQADQALYIAKENGRNRVELNEG
jgi:diguanylate cyclase